VPRISASVNAGKGNGVSLYGMLLDLVFANRLICVSCVVVSNPFASLRFGGIGDCSMGVHSWLRHLVSNVNS
jgi:hypothetical protein